MIILKRALLIFILALNVLNIQAQTEEYRSKKIAVIGDLQKTSALEFLMAREENDVERERIINSAAQQKPDVLVLLGDMVFDGSDRSQWNELSVLLRPLRALKIPFYPVLGNHEYWGSNSTAMKNVHTLFPHLKKKHWYSVVYDSLGLIFLDSNNFEYTTEEWDAQQKWFKAKLTEYESNPKIIGVFVFLHHPPYTNSIVTGDAIAIQMAFVPAFKSAKKTIAMFSGHAHTYEKFYIDKKYFIVSGGGGGPRVKLKTGMGFHNDLCKLPSPRPFHYILLERQDSSVSFTIKALDKGKTKIYDMEKFIVNIPQFLLLK